MSGLTTSASLTGLAVGLVLSAFAAVLVRTEPRPPKLTPEEHQLVQALGAQLITLEGLNAQYRLALERVQTTSASVLPPAGTCASRGCSTDCLTQSGWLMSNSHDEPLVSAGATGGV
jgi:hypothetical protein